MAADTTDGFDFSKILNLIGGSKTGTRPEQPKPPSQKTDYSGILVAVGLIVLIFFIVIIILKNR